MIRIVFIFFIFISIFSSYGQFMSAPSTNTQNNAFGPNILGVDLWIDNSQKTFLSSNTTGDNLGNVINTVTTRDINRFVTTPLASGAIVNQPRFNGEGLYFNGQYGFTAGVAGDWLSYHNGTAWTLYIVFKQLPLADNATPYTFIRSATSSSNPGFNIGYYNRAATSNQKTFQIFVSNGSGGTAQFLINGSANSVQDDDYNILKIKFSGTALTAWVKKRGGSYVQIGTDATGSTTGTNASIPLNIGSTANAWQGYLRHLVMFKRTLTSPEETQVETWADSEMEHGITEMPINVYVSGNAQSNFWGRGANGSASSDLSTSNGYSGRVGALVWYPSTNSNLAVIGRPFWAELQMGATSNPDFGETVHGFMNRFGYQLNRVSGKETAFLCYAVSSTQLKLATPGTIDWNVASVESGDLYPKWRDNLIPYGLNNLKHVLRRTPVFRGMVMMQGEADASNDGTTYRADQETWIKTAVDQLISYGYDCTKMRVWIFRISNQYSGFLTTPLSDVRTAQVNVGTNASPTDFSAYIPSKFKSITWSDTDAKALNGDFLHYSASGQDSMGMDLWNYFKNYINE